MDTFIGAPLVVSHNHKLSYCSAMYVKVKILRLSNKLLQNFIYFFTALSLKMELENTQEIALILTKTLKKRHVKKHKLW